MGFILGPMAETFFRRALMLSQGDYSPFVTRPISAMFLTLTVLFLSAMVIKNFRARVKAKASA
jgi:putative tricarboxylic transport membrane protein